MADQGADREEDSGGLSGYAHGGKPRGSGKLLSSHLLCVSIFELHCNADTFSCFQLADIPELELAPLEGYPPEFSQEVEVVPLPDLALNKRKAPTVAVGTKEVPVVKR